MSAYLEAWPGSYATAWIAASFCKRRVRKVTLLELGQGLQLAKAAKWRTFRAVLQLKPVTVCGTLIVRQALATMKGG